MPHNYAIHDCEQGSDEWHKARTGLLTASEVKLIVTPTLKSADNEKTRAHVWEIAAQRVTGYTEPTYISDDMLRGQADEITARELYSDRYDPVEEVGFITREVAPGVVIGYSPDGVGIMGGFGIECKSRRQKFQMEVIATNEVDKDHILQLQTGLLVTGWEYIDYISYCGGMPMWVIREYPRPEYQEAILRAAIAFEGKVGEVVTKYRAQVAACAVMIETDRENPETEVYLG